MKLSISVPDDLWAEAAPADSSPSEVVQQALSEMVSRRKPKSPWSRAPETGVVEECQQSLDAAVHRLLSERMQLRRAGYRVGAVFATDTSRDLDWFMWSVARLDPESLRAMFRDMLSDDPTNELVEPMISLAREAQVEPEWVPAAGDSEGDSEGEFFTLPEEFLAGLVDALFDIWDMVESQSAVKESS